MQNLEIECDRCKNDIYNEPTDVRIHNGGRTFGSTFAFDLCGECANELRVWIHTEPTT